MEYNTKTSNGKRFKIVKEKDDPMCLRVSLGGSKKDGYYLTFRGDPRLIADMLSEANEIFGNAANKFITQSN